MMLVPSLMCYFLNFELEREVLNMFNGDLRLLLRLMNN
jgi:hypothetical protein